MCAPCSGCVQVCAPYFRCVNVCAPRSGCVQGCVPHSGCVQVCVPRSGCVQVCAPRSGCVQVPPSMPCWCHRAWEAGKGSGSGSERHWQSRRAHPQLPMMELHTQPSDAGQRHLDQARTRMAIKLDRSPHARTAPHLSSLLSLGIPAPTAPGSWSVGTLSGRGFSDSSKYPTHPLAWASPGLGKGQGR